MSKTEDVKQILPASKRSEQAQRGSRERATCGEQQGVLMPEHATFAAAARAERAQSFESCKVRIFRRKKGKFWQKKTTFLT